MVTVRTPRRLLPSIAKVEILFLVVFLAHGLGIIDWKHRIVVFRQPLLIETGLLDDNARAAAKASAVVPAKARTRYGYRETAECWIPGLASLARQDSQKIANSEFFRSVTSMLPG